MGRRVRTPDGWGPPEPLGDVAAASADDPARVDAYVEHWFWLRAREAEAHGGRQAPPEGGVPARVPLPWPRSGGDWPRDRLRGLLLAVLADVQASPQDAVALHRDVYADLRADMGAYLRPDTLPGGRTGTVDPAPYLAPEARPGDGPACVVAVIDDAIPLAHPRLSVRAADGALVSRVASAWTMGARAWAPASEVPFGREWRGPEVDSLRAAHSDRGAGLDEEAMMRACGLWDAARGPLHAGGRRASHGAAVADLAAGMDPDDPAARQRPVIAVSLPPEVTRDTAGTFAPWFVLLAILHVLDRARRLAAELDSGPMPVAINLSYGVTAGSKDGGGLVEGLQGAVARADLPGIGPVRFVLPAGNHRQRRLRARVPKHGELSWQVPPDDATPSFLELWGPPQDTAPVPMRVRLRPPGGKAREARLAHGTASELTVGGRHMARAYLGLHRAPDGRTREVMTLALPATDEAADVRGPPGPWSLEVSGTGPFEAHIQRDDAIPGFGGGARQMRFADPDYAPHGPEGRPFPYDPPGAGWTRREGTINAWATGGAPAQVAVAGALPVAPPGPPWSPDAPPAGGGAPGKDAHYSGLPADAAGPDHPAALAMARAVCDLTPVTRGVRAAGGFAGATGRVTGTSVAAPQVTRAMADALAAGAAPGGPLRPDAPAERRGY